MTQRLSGRPPFDAAQGREPVERLRLLCVSPFFPPAAHAEAFVAAKWATALVDRGVDVTVLRDDGDADLPEDRSPCWAPLAAHTVAVDARGKGVRNLLPVGPEGAAHKRFLTPFPLETLAFGLRYRVWRLYPRWIRRVVSGARELHSASAFDAVVSRSLPMRAHAAGYWCARALGVPWVAVINDPWDLHLFPGRVKEVPRWRRVVSARWLDRTLKRARLVFGPCARLNDYNLRLARSSRRVEVLPHVGWSRAASGENGDSPQKTGAVPFFRLVHVGTLGPEPLTGGRPARALVEALAGFLARRPDARATARLRLVGAPDPDTQAAAASLGIADAVGFTGRVDYEQSLREIAAADVCVLVEAPMEEGIYLPSKLADYVAAGKPVLALSPRTGTVADLQPDAGLSRADVDDAGAISREIESLYEGRLADGLASRRPSERLAAMFRPRRVADVFLEKLREAHIG